MNRTPPLVLRALFLALFALASSAHAQEMPTIEAHTAGFTRLDGFFPLYWDEAAGKIWLEVSRLDEEFLYATSLPAGLGSNDVGLDRGQLGTEHVVRFERVGPQVLLVASNLRYRAHSDNAAERRAVRDAFAESVVWGFSVAAETEGRVLVDATDFMVRDAHGIANRLQETEQGTFQLDPLRSAPHLPATRSFPANTELEARLTFVSQDPGEYVRDVAADPYAVTLRIRHSLVKLPPPGFEPRAFHPNSGFFSMAYQDYAAPIGASTTRRLITRHRLEKVHPDSASSPVVEPIVYHLDPGTPEPVRSALLEGAAWWAEAFEAAGFRDAFRVEMLPDTADPLDVRYNVIQWVHRATRGWSYGSSVVDPRTGEIIKGHVTLGSLRVRQDYLLAEGLLAPYDSADARGLPPEEDPMLAMALARLRQLSAHEVGHTLGLAHNFAASAEGRASVMDYPAPLARVTEAGTVSLEEAYDAGIGAWDRIAIRYGYTQFADSAREAEGLAAILEDARARGLTYLTDEDARPEGAAQPMANLWDNGADVLQAFEEELRVREVALARFDQTVIREGEPLALLEDVLVPLYLRHRYQAEAVAKLLGGLEYHYALRGEVHPPPAPVSAEAQRAALDALLRAVTPETLRLPPMARTHIPPRPPGYAQTRELFDGHTGPTFDPYAPAAVAASMIFELLLQPERAARLAHQADFDPRLPDLHAVLERANAYVWQTPASPERYDAELQRVTQRAWVDALLDVASREKLAPVVQATLLQQLRTLRAWLKKHPGNRRDPETRAHRAYLLFQINHFFAPQHERLERHVELATPPGPPIGTAAPDYLRRQQQRRAQLDAWSPRLDCEREE